MMSRLPVLVLLAGILARPGLCQPTDTRPDSELPVSLTLSTVYSIGLETGNETLIFGGTAVYRVSGHLGLGLGLRVWWTAAGREACPITDGSCLLTEELDALAGLAIARLTPLRTRRLHFRLGAGVTQLREQSAPGYVIRQTVDWPFTLLAGVVSDLPVLDRFYLSPSLEIIRCFVSDDALAVSPDWIVQAGLGLTVG